MLMRLSLPLDITSLFNPKHTSARAQGTRNASVESLALSTDLE